MSLRPFRTSATAHRENGSCNKDHRACRLGHGGTRSTCRAASGGLTEVGAPYVEVAVIDDAIAIAIAVGGKPIAYLTKGFAPDDVIGRVDNCVVVIVAR